MGMDLITNVVSAPPLAHSAPHLKIPGYGPAVITVVESARNLGVIIDSQLSMDVHAAALCRSGYYQLHVRQLRPVTRSLTTTAVETV